MTLCFALCGCQWYHQKKIKSRTEDSSFPSPCELTMPRGFLQHPRKKINPITMSFLYHNHGISRSSLIIPFPELGILDLPLKAHLIHTATHSSDATGSIFRLSFCQGNRSQPWTCPQALWRASVSNSRTEIPKCPLIGGHVVPQVTPVPKMLPATNGSSPNQFQSRRPPRILASALQLRLWQGPLISTST